MSARDEGEMEAKVAANEALRQREKAEAARRRRESGWQVPADAERKPRTLDEMESEAKWLSTLLNGEANGSS